MKEMDSPDECAVEARMCSTQLGRHNLTDAERAYLIGKLYSAQKKIIRKGGVKCGVKNQSPVPRQDTAAYRG